MFELDNILRKNIKDLKPYSSARDEFKGNASIFLDANENSYGTPLDKKYNRYPDPLQLNLKTKISKIKGLPIENIFVGNGSDEAIDILFRAFCNPGTDNVIIPFPTYGMYEVSANINDVAIQKAPLSQGFQLDMDAISNAIDANTKLIFICSPNNPTGNSFFREDIETILNNFNGIVVIDEAYINFSKQKSFIPELTEYPNLVVLQTLSKAWGMAGLRVGMALASQQIIDVFNKVKPPYNINEASQELAIKALDNITQVNDWIKIIVAEREKLAKELSNLKCIVKLYPSDSNFILAKVTDANKIYEVLVGCGIIVRNRSSVAMCEGCLRITVGTEKENAELLNILKKF